MTTCTFWGGDLFEPDVWQRLAAELEQLLTRDDEFVFYFSLDTPFERLAYSVLREARPHYRRKRISIEWMGYRKRAPRTGPNAGHLFLADQPFNQRVILPMPPTMSSAACSRRVLKWRLSTVSHLFFYFYDLLFLADMRLLHMVRKRVERGELELIPLTDPLTERRLEQHLSTLSTNEQALIKSLFQGKTLVEAGKQLNIPTSSVHFRCIEAQYKLLDTVERFPFEL